jgi:hypothetical protein
MSLQVNGQSLKTGAPGLPFPQDQQSALIVTELNSRYYLNTYNAQKFTASAAGGGVAAAATQLFSTAIASFTPILAIYNPLTSIVNLEVDHIWAGLSAAPLATPTQTGALILVVGSGQSITNAQSATPVNNKTLKASGSQAIGISNAVLAGASGNAIVLRPMSGLIELVTATAGVAGLVGAINVEDVAGSIIVPPGGYLGIATGISNAVSGHLYSAGITWNEISL